MQALDLLRFLLVIASAFPALKGYSEVVRCNLPDNNRETVGVVPICVDAKTHTPRCMTGTSKISKFDQRVWSVTLKLSRQLMPKNPHTTNAALVVGG